MVRKKDKRKLIIIASVVGVLLIAIGTVAVIRAFDPERADPYVVRDDSSQTSSTSDEKPTAPAPNDENSNASKNGGAESESTESEPAIDPATVNTIDIAPMEITVSYVKGIGGFEYEVLRTPNGSQYVEFRSAELIGTKCTNDQGAFASILADPSAGENSTITKTTALNNTKYGLSLSAATCTSDAAELQKYQQSFSDAFGLLKAIN